MEEGCTGNPGAVVDIVGLMKTPYKSRSQYKGKVVVNSSRSAKHCACDSLTLLRGVSRGDHHS